MKTSYNENELKCFYEKMASYAVKENEMFS